LLILKLLINFASNKPGPFLSALSTQVGEIAKSATVKKVKAESILIFLASLIVNLAFCLSLNAHHHTQPCFINLLDPARSLVNLDPSLYAERFQKLDAPNRQQVLDDIAQDLSSKERPIAKDEHKRKLIFALHVALNPYEFFSQQAEYQSPLESLRLYHEKLCHILKCQRDSKRFNILIEQIKLIFQDLRTKNIYNNSTLVLFGSAIAGSWREHSDLDIAFSYFPYPVNSQNPTVSDWNHRFANINSAYFPIDRISMISEAQFFSNYVPLQIVITPYSAYLEIKDLTQPETQKLTFLLNDFLK
jgi:hypothetical protein